MYSLSPIIKQYVVNLDPSQSSDRMGHCAPPQKKLIFSDVLFGLALSLHPFTVHLSDRGQPCLFNAAFCRVMH